MLSVSTPGAEKGVGLCLGRTVLQLQAIGPRGSSRTGRAPRKYFTLKAKDWH